MKYYNCGKSEYIKQNYRQFIKKNLIYGIYIRYTIYQQKKI